ncbi:hypothetical protein BO71DRAFT_321637, partial [Aspergillus ellipticus CBS 707.79]
ELRRKRICACFTADGRGPTSDAKNTWRRTRGDKETMDDCEKTTDSWLVVEGRGGAKQKEREGDSEGGN